MLDEEVRTALSPLKLNSHGVPEVDVNTQQSSEPWVWVGGDVGGVAVTTVESVNDGKTAAWGIHRYLQGLEGFHVEQKPKLPLFHTSIDEVDLSLEVCGIKFEVS